MFMRSSSILMMRASISWPMNSLMSLVRRMETWLAGRKTGTPMSTSRPPLIFWMTRPRTVAPSPYSLTIALPAADAVGLALAQQDTPAAFVDALEEDLELVAHVVLVMSSNSLIEMTPSDL